jgi:hypothetical protein
MRRIFPLVVSIFLLIAAGSVFAGKESKNGKSMESAKGKSNVIVRFNGGGDNNKVYIGEKNTLEILISNPVTLQSMSIGFGFITKAKGFKIVTGYGDINGTADGVKGILKDHANAKKNFNMGGVLVNDQNLPDQILIGGVSTPGPQFPASAEPRLVYSLQIEIPKDAKPARNGFCIDNVYIPPGGSWEFNDGKNEIVPLYNGHENTSTSQPSAPSVCFDLVKR